MKELYSSAGVVLSWRPEVPCLMWQNKAPTNSEEFADAVQATWKYIKHYIAEYPNMGVLMDVSHAGLQGTAEVHAAAALGAKNANTLGLRKMAVVFTDADEPMQSLAILLEHAETSVVQVRLFATQTLAERWLREKV